VSGRLHDYKLIRAIGKGAFGRTYLASTVGRSKRQVTVEFLDVEPTKIGGVLGALHMRVSQCNDLRHPFIARQEGVQNVNGRPALISENVDGCTLGDVTNAGAIPVGVACAIAKKLARALHASYDRTPKGRDQAFNLVHGDLLPSQVWLTTNGRVKLFGVGLTPSEQSRPRDSVRALLPWPTGYSPPESHTGIDVHGGDVYSLAALLAELITGAVPAFASTNEEWHDAVAASTAERVREISGDNQLGFLVSDCLAFNHESRPTAAEIENRLTKICGRHTTPNLADWAEEVIPPIRDSAYRAAAAGDPWNLIDVEDEPVSTAASTASAEPQSESALHASTEEPAAPAPNTFAAPLEEIAAPDGSAEAPPPVSEQGEEMSLLPSDSTDLVEDP